MQVLKLRRFKINTNLRIIFLLISSKVSTGSLLKDEVSKITDIGSKVKSFIDEGQLVPDAAMFTLIERTLDKVGYSRVVFDGFPRTLTQAQKLDEILPNKGRKLYAVIYLDIPDQKLMERRTGRWTHKSSGRTYHTSTNPPKAAGKDDITGEPLIQADEDKEENVKKKLEEFHTTCDPIIEYYEKKGILRKVNADQTIDEIWNEVDKIVAEVIETYKTEKKALQESNEAKDVKEEEQKQEEAPKEEEKPGEADAAKA